MPIQRVNVLGVGVSALNMELAAREIFSAIEKRQKGYICVTGVHGVMECQTDAKLRDIHNNAFLVTPDGVPMTWMGRAQGFSWMNRVYGPDLMLDILANSQARNVRHFFYGGANGAAEELKARMENRFPGLQIVGIYEPPFRPLNEAEETDLKRMIQSTRPDVVWVGLGAPKQERFMAQYLPKLDTTLMVGVGAAFDFHAGRLRQAPRWMQRSGLEWLFRLVMEPKRLWRRYFKNNPRFIWLALAQLLGIKKFALPEPQP